MPGGYHGQTKSHPYDDALERTRIAVKQGTLKGILWHQGESDCKPQLAEKYQQNLEELIEHARDLSTSDTIVKFDTDRSEDLCSILKTLETRIDSSIAKINAYAEQCGRAPIQVQTIPSETKKPRR